MQANFQLLTRDSAIAGGLQLAFTQCQTPDNIVLQGVLHPARAVRVGVVSPLLARAVTVLFSWELPRKIFLWP